jgi:predicted transposase YbfD/YdcC
LQQAEITEEVQMKHITFTNEQSEHLVFDMGQLLERLAKVTDLRNAKGKRYPLPIVLASILLAKLCGEQKPTGITEWIKLRRKQLMTAFQCQRQTAPSLNTIRRIMEDAIIAEEMHQILRTFLHQEYGGQQSVLIVLDGKTMRGTIPKGKTRGIHLLAAYLPEEGIVLLQVVVDSKENEVSAAPRLIEKLDLRQRVVCGDALFTQRDLSVQIIAQGGDYIWFVKDNQPQLGADVEQFFVPPRKAQGWHIEPLPRETAQTTGKAHGRLEQRTLTLISDETQFVEWPGLRQVFRLERRVVSCRTGECTCETVYGITSLSPDQVDARQMLQWTQSYWGIENGLHYRRDTTLQEDATRMSGKNKPEVMATLNNFIVGLANKLGFTNLASAQRVFDAKVNIALLDYL